MAAACSRVRAGCGRTRCPLGRDELRTRPSLSDQAHSSGVALRPGWHHRLCRPHAQQETPRISGSRWSPKITGAGASPTDTVARSVPDGYTLVLMIPPSSSIRPCRRTSVRRSRTCRPLTSALARGAGGRAHCRKRPGAHCLRQPSRQAQLRVAGIARRRTAAEMFKPHRHRGDPHPLQGHRRSYTDLMTGKVQMALLALRALPFTNDHGAADRPPAPSEPASIRCADCRRAGLPGPRSTCGWACARPPAAGAGAGAPQWRAKMLQAPDLQPPWRGSASSARHQPEMARPSVRAEFDKWRQVIKDGISRAIDRRMRPMTPPGA